MRLLTITLCMLAIVTAHAGDKNEKRDKAPNPVLSLKRSDTAFRLPSPDGKLYLVNQDDEKGNMQVYVGKTGSSTLTCITEKDVPNGPKGTRLKMQAHWHPNGKWIFMAVEREEYTPPPILGSNRAFVEGQLQCGIWTDMYAVSPDGKQWHRMTNFKSNVPGTADGFTGPAFTNDGKKAVWSQIVDGCILVYWPFGRWELIVADYEEKDGVPTFTNLKDITPKGMHWNEPGNFAPDNWTLLLTGSTDRDAQGMDQYTLNIKTGELKNLTNTPTVWDEHGVFSPDGEKIIFMSAYPYRDDPNSSKILTIKTEFMLMNKDGSGLTQLTHFRGSGYPESGHGIAACGGFHEDGKSLTLSTLVFPKYEYWEMVLNPALFKKSDNKR